MTTINSVLGPIDTADLGVTLAHEHIMCTPAGVLKDYPELVGPDPVDRAVEALKKAKEGNIDTIVDATTQDLGRNIEMLTEVSQGSGVNIIACTGWWLDFPRFFAGISPNQLADRFIKDIRQGISGTDIKAGVLKSASDMAGVTPNEEIVLRAVARASLETGVPIMLHSYSPGQVGRQQLAILKEAGIKPNRIKMDHSNDTTDVDYLSWLLDQGCYLGFDRYPGMMTSPLSRTKTLKSLIDAGYADQLCLSHDHITLRVLVDNPIITEEERLKRNPHGYLYISKVVLPELRRMGISDSIIDGLCINGPKNFFEAE